MSLDTWSGGGATLSLSDPYYVIDWNDGLTLSTEAVEYESEGDSVDLRAQVQGATVASYEWDLDDAPDATQVSGTDTYHLALRWGDVSSGNSSTNQIGLTITYTDYSTTVLQYDFEVINDGTASGGSGGGDPPVSAEWPEVLTPDLISSDHEAVAGDGYSVATATGEFAAGLALPSYDPGAPLLGLYYNSESASPQPIFLERYELDPAQGIPESVSAKLTLDGVSGQEYFYSTTDLNPGDIMQIALQADASGLSTGRYDWRIDVTAHYEGEDVSTFNTGDVTILNHAAGATGDGWQIAGVTRLHPLAAGAILDLGNGHGLWFQWDAQTESYLTPAGDFSTLVQNVDDTFTRTLKTGEQYHFDSSGKQTSLVDRNDNTIEYAYDGSGRLTSITDQNSLVTSLAYTDGLLATITDPADRVSTLTHDSGGALTDVALPDDSTWSFAYDAAGRMTSREDPRSQTASFSYDFAGRISGTTRADETGDALAPLQTQGLVPSGSGTAEYPAAAVLLAAAVSAYTDGRDNDWHGRYDWSGFGKGTGAIDPLDYLSVTHRDLNGLPSQHTDQLNRNTVFWRDNQGNATQVTHPDYSLETFEYNAYSQVTEHVDAVENTWTYTYDAQGNLTDITDPLLNTRSFTYTDDGLVATATDELGRVTTFDYDARDRLVEMILPDGTPGTQEDNPRELFDWDDAGNLVETTDPLGRVTVMAYDVMGRLTELTLPDETPGDPDDNPEYAYTYDARGNRLTTTDPLDNVATWAYDPLNRVASVTDPLENETAYAYDAEGHLVSTTDPLDRTTTRAYDAVGNLTSITDPLENVSSYTVDAARQVTETTDPLSNTTTFDYNSRGWNTRVTDPASGAVLKGYNAQGWMGSLAESGGGQFTYEHDALGRLTVVTDPFYNETTYTYDDAGNLIQKTDALDNVTTWEYDEQNRVVAMTDPLDQTTTYEYDLAGNLVSVTDALDRTTQYQYDAQNRLVKIIDAADAETLLAYDLAGRLASVTDANDNATSYAYDAASRLTAETDPLDHETSYSYDDAGQLTGIEDRNGRERSFTYDLAGRLTAEDWLAASGGSLRTISYDYDDQGNLTEVTDPDATYAFTYDADNRLTAIDNTGTPGLPDVVLSLAYDSRDNRTGLSDDLGGEVAYTYDLGNRMTSAALSVTGVYAEPTVDLTYDAAWRLTGLSRSEPYGWSGGSGGGTDVDTAITYDAASRVTDITHTASYNTLASYGLTWDAAGQLTQEVSDDGTVNFTYDVTAQLTGASGGRSETYTYDALGNRTMSGYETGTGNRVLSDGTFDYTYDNEGNMLTKTEIATGKVTEYTWDYRNRLTSVKLKDAEGTVIGQSDYTYDALDKRIGVAVDPDGEGSEPAVERWTVYDGSNPYADLDGSGELTHRYLYGPAVDMIVGRLSAAGEAAWYLADHLGTVRDLADTSGNVIDHVAYNSFGGILSESNPSAGDRFKFTGREYDPATGLYYYRARYYDAAIGRFLSEDPKRFEADDVNLYRYVLNSPTANTDPTGLQTVPLPNPGIIYDFMVEAAGAAAKKGTFEKFLVNTVAVLTEGFTKTQGEYTDLNSAIADAVGFNLNAWQLAKWNQEGKSTATVKIQVTGKTTLLWWVHGNVVDPKTGLRTGRLDYQIYFRQEVTVTNLRTGVSSKKGGIIFSTGGRIYANVFKGVKCGCHPVTPTLAPPGASTGAAQPGGGAVAVTPPPGGAMGLATPSPSAGASGSAGSYWC